MATMNVGAGIYRILSTTAGVTAVVSTRIYPGVAPEGVASPFLVYQRESTDYEKHLGGNNAKATSMVRVISVASTLSGAESLAKLVRGALDWYSNTVTSGSDTLAIERMTIESDTLDYSIPEGSDSPDWIVTQTYRVRHAV